MSLFKFHKAFTCFYNTYKDEVYGYILVRANFNEDVSVDIVSDIFIKAYGNFDLTILNLRAWIFKISKNTLIDYYRKSKSQSLEISELDKLFDETEHFYHQLEVDLTMQQVCKNIETLSSKQKDIVEAYYIDNRTTFEISQSFNITEDAVRQNLSRGVRRLRKIYEE